MRTPSSTSGSLPRGSLSLRLGVAAALVLVVLALSGELGDGDEPAPLQGRTQEPELPARTETHRGDSGVRTPRLSDADRSRAPLAATPKAGIELQVTVVAGADDDLPVSGATCRLGPEASPFAPLVPGTEVAKGRTDGRGRIAFRSDWKLAAPYTLEVSCPPRPAAVHSVVLADLAEGTKPGSRILVVHLDEGGSVAGRVELLGRSAAATYSIVISAGSPRVEQRFPDEVVVPTAEKGLFALQRMPPGAYRFALYEADRSADAEWPLSQGRFWIEEGSTTDLLIDVVPWETQPLAAIHGEVRLAGEPAVGLRVDVYHPESERLSSTRAGATGEYELNAVVPGRSSLHVFLPGRAVAIHTQPLRVEAGEVRRLDVELDRRPYAVRVEDSTGAALEGARLRAFGHALTRGAGWSAETDETGRCELYLEEAGSYQVNVEHPRASFEARLDVSEEPWFDTLLLRGPDEVVCSGRVFAAGTEASVDSWILFLHRLDEEGELLTSTHARVDPVTHSFELRGQSPGDFRAILSVPGAFSHPVEFDLPRRGASALTLEFEF